jgi:hypothetical protein
MATDTLQPKGRWGEPLTSPAAEEGLQEWSQVLNGWAVLVKLGYC